MSNKILLVEDDMDNIIIVKKYLEKSNFQILSVENGLEAIKTLNENPDFDLIITDISMPVMDGIEFCRYIRTHEKFNLMPILMLTGSSDISSKFLGFDAGTDDYITKPFEPIELMLRIKALLKRTRRETDIQNINSGSKSPFLFEERVSSDSKININGREVYFTSLEFDIFHYLCKNKGRFVTNEEILNKVLNYPNRTGNPEIVRTHIKNIRNKVEKESHNPMILKNQQRKGYYIDFENLDL